MARATNLEEAIRVLNPQKRLGGRELDEFYVSRDSRALERIKTLLLQASEVKVLFTGHRGVGKSTELAQLQKDLDQFWTVFFSVFNKLDPNYLDYRDILFSIPLQILLKVKADRQIKLNPKTIRRIEEFQAVVETEKVSEGRRVLKLQAVSKNPSSASSPSRLSFPKKLLPVKRFVKTLPLISPNSIFCSVNWFEILRLSLGAKKSWFWSRILIKLTVKLLQKSFLTEGSVCRNYLLRLFMPFQYPCRPVNTSSKLTSILVIVNLCPALRCAKKMATKRRYSISPSFAPSFFTSAL